MGFENNITLLSQEIQSDYVNYRKNGFSRDATVSLIREEYHRELNDEDDRIAVLSGLVLALCKGRELYETIANETAIEIQRAKRYYASDRNVGIFLAGLEAKLMNADLYGDEAKYKKVSAYRPNWEVGDVFSRTLTYPTAKDLGIMGWSILFYKVADYVDKFNVQRQLMLVSLCSSGDFPCSYTDLKKIGFLPMYGMGERLEYIAQLVIKSKRQEAAYHLTKIGNFKYPEDAFIEQCKQEKPLTAMPLFGKLRRNDLWPAYEDQICRLYKKYKSTMMAFWDAQS